MTVNLEGIGCVTGIAPWKRGRVLKMLRNANGPPFQSDPAKAVALARQNGGALACWATRLPPDLPQMAAQADVALWQIEDGFIRSNGLGAALVQPCSLALDSKGAHYDPSCPSDLEEILQNRQFSRQDRDRAQALISSIIRRDITKYNLAGTEISLPKDRKIVLVIGQVADDQSMQLGSGGMTCEQLLHEVRIKEPDAFLVYRPHPDVAQGLRQGLGGEDHSGEADLVAAQASITQLINAADSVHTITSLAGFEAILRGRHVVTYGAPFYAGWGLSEDRLTYPRRSRKLDLAELVCGVLIDYPIYGDPSNGTRCQVEELVAKLAAAPNAHKIPVWRKIVAKLALSGAITSLSKPSSRIFFKDREPK